MGILDRVHPRVGAALSVESVRLILREPAQKSAAPRPATPALSLKAVAATRAQVRRAKKKKRTHR